MLTEAESNSESEELLTGNLLKILPLFERNILTVYTACLCIRL